MKIKNLLFRGVVRGTKSIRIMLSGIFFFHSDVRGIPRIPGAGRTAL